MTNMYPPHHLGGYELSCRDVVERFRARGHEVTVLATSFQLDGVEWHERADGVRRTLDFYWRNEKPWTPKPLEVLALERRVHNELRAALTDVDPDVVSVWNMGAVPLSAIATLIESGRPLVYHTCNDWPTLNLVLDAFRSLLDRRPRTTRLAARVLGLPTELPDLGRSGTFCWVSKSTWDANEEKSPWTFPRSVVVHSGISHDDFPPVDPPAEARPWRGRLLYVGRVEGTKSTRTAIEALATLDGATLDIVGPADQRYLRALQKLIDELQLADRVTFRTVPRHDLRDVYLDADAVLFTSAAEPFGLVPIEAMACAIPVVASGAGGSKEFLVDGVNSLLYEPGDSASLAHAVRRLADDAELRLRLARGGLVTANEYTVDRLADRLEEAHLAAAGDVSA